MSFTISSYSIFYNALTPIKLESFLKGTEKKGPDQTKNIPLLRLKNNDKNELHKILLQFGFDRNEQGTGELVRKAISIEDIEKIDSIRSTPYAGNEYEAIACIDGQRCGNCLVTIKDRENVVNADEVRESLDERYGLIVTDVLCDQCFKLLKS